MSIGVEGGPHTGHELRLLPNHEGDYGSDIIRLPNFEIIALFREAHYRRVEREVKKSPYRCNKLIEVPSSYLVHGISHCKTS